LLAHTSSDIAVTKGGDTFVTGSTHHLEKWEARSGKPIWRVQKGDRADITLAFDSKAGAMARAGRGAPSLADLAAAQAKVTLDGAKGHVQIIGLSPDGAVFALDNASSITLHSSRTGAKIAKLNFQPSFLLEGRLCFTGDSRSVLTWDSDLILWDVKTGAERKRWELPGRCLAVGMSADGKEPSVALLRDHKDYFGAYLWSVQLGERVATLRCAAYIEAAAFAADGQMLATITSDGTVRLWDAVTGQPRGLLLGHPRDSQRLAFRPDGRAFAAGGYRGAISLWTDEE
jgi:WD40 repeat protein